MSRIVSVWLPRWPIQRFLAAQRLDPQTNPRASDPPTRNPSEQPVDPEQPFVLAIAGSGGLRVAALNAAAEQAGLAVGESVADARAKTGSLQVRAVDPAADDDALRRLTLWATRYTPTASLWREDNGADGFFLEIAGSAHLFGGEDKLIADLAARLDRFGLAARLAVATTPGAAWAACRFHRPALFVLPCGEEAAALSAMPIEALRLTPETRAALRRLGFKTIGALIDQPRAPFAARFAAELLRRLDQALGRVDEPIVPIVEPPIYHSLHYLLEPIVSAPAIVARARRLMQNLVHVLLRDDVGARALRLCLYGLDGAVETLDIGLTLPTRSIDHVARLIALKLDAVAAETTKSLDAGFGFEAIGLAVTRAEPMPARQTEFASSDPSSATEGGSGWGHDDRAERCAALIDALRQRLGPNRVRRFEALASHLPERAEALPPIEAENYMPPPARGRLTAAGRRVGVRGRDISMDPSPDRLRRSGPPLSAEGWPAPEQKPRPLLLLPRAEPTEVMALIPDGPPRRFCWRGVTYDITGAEGPERIADEWWRVIAADAKAVRPTRDYYLVEDAGGRRFWLFREGLYGRETAAARWFVQGLFA